MPTFTNDDEMVVQQHDLQRSETFEQCHSDYATNSSPICKILTYSDRYPLEVLKWIKANAPPRQSLKLMKVCRYFKHRNFPYYVIKEIEFLNCCESLMLDGTKHCTESIENLPDNLWIVEMIKLYQVKSLAPLLQKITVCDIKYLYLYNCCPTITFDDFKILTSSGNVQDLTYPGSTVIYENGEAVPFEVILQCVPNVVAITLKDDFPPIRSLAAANKAVPKTMRFFEFTTDIEMHHFDLFSIFMLQNQQIEYFLSLEYSSDDYEEELPPVELSQNYIPYLRLLVDNIIDKWSPVNSPPIINFTEQFRPSYDAMDRLHRLYFEIRDSKKAKL